MKTITIRGIEPDIMEKMKQTAKQKGKSLNQLLLDTLKQSMGLSKKKKFTETYHDLDHLLGRWSKDDFNIIDKKIRAERQIDRELWK